MSSGVETPRRSAEFAEEGAAATTGHLIHIGYPKTGSTFLQGWFNANPQLAFLIDGLAGFRSVGHVVGSGAAGPHRVMYRVTSEEGLSMPRLHPWRPPLIDLAEAQTEVCTMLAEVFPNARILLVTRGFRSMIRSLYAEWVRRGLHLDITAFCERMTEIFGGDLLDYDHLISLYQRAFGADRMLILPYELLRDDQTAFIRALETWLGLDHFLPGLGRANAAISSHELYWFPRIARIGRALPMPAGLSRRLRDNYHVLAEKMLLRRAFRLIGRARPDLRVTDEAVPDQFVESCRGKAGRLRNLPLFAPYSEEYLL